MSTAILQELSSYFTNMDPEDPIYQKELIRPAEIKEDVKLMEQRKRVTNIMRSKLFKKDLENIFRLNQFDNEGEGECTSTLSLADISEQLLLSALPKNKIESLYQLSQKKGIICINDLHCGNNSPYEQPERLNRCKLVSVFRLADMYGWNSGFNDTMTVKPFRDREHFLVNPFGLMAHELTASSLLCLDFKGNILDFGSTVLETHATNWMVHSSIYSSRPEIRAILHLKTPAALAVSSLDRGLLPLSAEAMILGHVLSLDRLSEIEQKFRTTSLILAELKNYLTTLLTSKSKVLIVPTNGFLICGETIEEAWHLLTNCQQACDTQLKLGNLSEEDLFIPQKHVQDGIFNQWRTTDVGGIRKTGESEKDYYSQWRIGELEFEALMRHLDNNGYRSGYFYHEDNIYKDDQWSKSERHKANFEVEIPPSCISAVTTSRQIEESTANQGDDGRMNKSTLRTKTEKWFNTPNSYKLIEESGDSVNNLSFNFVGSQSDRKSAKWVSAKEHNFSAPIPRHPVTAGAYVAFGCDTSKSDISRDRTQPPRINPKELKENQKRVKNKYYHDTNTAGPISCLLDSGLSREEARRLQSATLQKQIGSGSNASDPVVTAASKAIIQRGHKALVYQDLYKPANPFEHVTTDELDSYHKEIDRKLNPDRYVDSALDMPPCPKDEAPEIRITSSQSEATMRQRSLVEDQSARHTTVSEQFEHNTDGDIECDPFFKTDFDEDFKNLHLNDSVRTSTLKVSDTENESGAVDTSTLVVTKQEIVPDKISPMDPKMKRKNAEAQASKCATLAAPGPGTGTMTSETSGADVSHDEADKEGKAKKKKRRFKLPSFSKKKKDKAPKN